MLINEYYDNVVFNFVCGAYDFESYIVKEYYTGINEYMAACVFVFNDEEDEEHCIKLCVAGKYGFIDNHYFEFPLFMNMEGTLTTKFCALSIHALKHGKKLY